LKAYNFSVRYTTDFTASDAGPVSLQVAADDGYRFIVDGKEVIRDRVTGTADDPGSMGIQLAERLLARGGDRILQAIYGKVP